MKFVKETVDTLPKEEIDALLNEVSNDNNEIETINAAAKKLQDKLGIEETKQPVEEKSVANRKDMVTMTLVNMRKAPSKTAEIVMTIKGGETVSADSLSSNGYTNVKYKGKEGYIDHKYLR